jgi:transposase
MRTQGSALELQRVRLIAANMFARAISSADIALNLGVHVQTVRHWRRLWNKQGSVALISKAHPGRPSLLDDAKKQQLLQWLKVPPTEHGFERHFWTTAMIRDLIHRKFDVRFNHNWVGQMLHDLGLSWQKPMRRARERKEDQIAAWRSEVWPALEKKAKKKTE